MSVRILLVDDHELFAESVAVALCRRGHDARSLHLVPEQTQSALLTAIRNARPVVVVLDLNLGPRIDGAGLIAPLDRDGIDVVVVTAATEPLVWGACLAQGAAAVVAKHAPLDEVLETAHRLAIGQPAMPAERRRELVTQWRERGPVGPSDRQRLTSLTPRERQVLEALAAGRQVPDIASDVELSEATVRTHVKAILGKLGVSSQLSAAVVLQRYDRQQGRSSVSRRRRPRRPD